MIGVFWWRGPFSCPPMCLECLAETSPPQQESAVASHLVAGEWASALAALHAEEKKGGREEDARGVITPAGSRLQVGI